MYTVVGTLKSRAFRVVWGLEEMGLEYRSDPVPVRSPALQAVNPSGKSPVLLVDGRAISDSSAILQFLADRHGQLTHPAGSLERAEQDSLLHFINDEIDGALWTSARHKFALPKDKRVPALRPTLEWEFARSIGVLETRLGDRAYLTGDRFTVPDIILGHCLAWAENVRMPVESETVRAYAARVHARPAYRRTDAISAAA